MWRLAGIVGFENRRSWHLCNYKVAKNYDYFLNDAIIHLEKKVFSFMKV